MLFASWFSGVFPFFCSFENTLIDRPLAALGSDLVGVLARRLKLSSGCVKQLKNCVNRLVFVEFPCGAVIVFLHTAMMSQ